MRLRLAAAFIVSAFCHPVAAQGTRAGGTDSAAVFMRKLALAKRLVPLTRILGTAAIQAETVPTDPAHAKTAFARQTDRALAAWSGKYMPNDSLIEIDARAFATEFDLADLRDLLAFYQSPLGQKFVAAQPKILRYTTLETNRVLAPHRQELRDMLQKVAIQIDSI